MASVLFLCDFFKPLRDDEGCWTRRILELRLRNGKKQLLKQQLSVLLPSLSMIAFLFQTWHGRIALSLDGTMFVLVTCFAPNQPASARPDNSLLDLQGEVPPGFQFGRSCAHRPVPQACQWTTNTVQRQCRFGTSFHIESKFLCS